MMQFVRTAFLGWRRPDKLTLEQRLSVARGKASEVQELLASPRVIEAYQSTLDTLVDQILNAPAGPRQAELVMPLLQQAQGLIAVFRQLGRYSAEAEQLEAALAKSKRDSSILRRRAA